MKLTTRGKQIRRDVIKLSKANGGYHYGGSFSCVEILIALLDPYEGLRLVDPIGSAKLILSKGHACWPLYVMLMEDGLAPKLGGHPIRDPNNGIQWTTGSLGHGLPAGIGMAIAKKRKGDASKVYVLISDGECQAGTTWESLLIAAQHKLNNLCVIVDMNGIQGSGFTRDIVNVTSLPAVASATGWESYTVDGHSIGTLRYSLAEDGPSLPRIVFANTIKGRGVKEWEGEPKWHAKWPNPQEEASALRQLGATS